MDVNFLLDKCKEVCGVRTEVELAGRLGVSKQALSGYRHGSRSPDPVVCATIAGLSGIPLARVLGIVGEARAISREEKAVWRKLAATAMTLLLGVGVALPPSAQAAESAGLGATVYTLCEVVKKRLIWVLWWIQSLLPSPAPSDTEIEA
jgi:transcriptional regulator with XRE-family HTH domain